MNLPIGAIVKFGSNKLTDHNRDAVSISWDKIEYKKRMANGTLRRFVVADKRKIKISWTNLPKADNQTVDHFWGALSIIDFYQSTPGAFTITLTYGDNSTEDLSVMFDSFNHKISKRSKYTDLYDIDLTLEEV